MEDRRKAGQTARRMASMGILPALALVPDLAAGMLPALPAMPPGVRPGLSNIVVLCCILCLGRKEAVTIVLLKSGFVFLKASPPASSACAAAFPETTACIRCTYVCPAKRHLAQKNTLAKGLLRGK